MTLSIGAVRARGVRRGIDLVAHVALIAVAVVLVAIVIALTTGFRALVVRSGSMAPAVETGDVVITRIVGPGDVQAGDVVTFRDPTRADRLVTHRLVEAQLHGATYDFVTRGDANTGSERWTIEDEGTVGRLAWSIPKIGFAVVWATQPAARTALLVGAALLLGFAALRWIWQPMALPRPEATG